MLLEFHHELFGRYGMYAAPNGASDLPTTGGAFVVGDIVVNFNPSTNAVAMWQCTQASPNPLWEEMGAGTQIRTVASPTTITSADGIVVLTSAGTETLPAAAAWPAGQQVLIKNASAGNVTLTPTSGTIDGNASLTLATYTQAGITSNGTNYYRISS